MFVHLNPAHSEEINTQLAEQLQPLVLAPARAANNQVKIPFRIPVRAQAGISLLVMVPLFSCNLVSVLDTKVLTLTCVALPAFALVAAGRVLAQAVRSAGIRIRGALVNVLARELRVSRETGRTLTEVAARRVDTLGA